jgi:hypothetical protein
MQAEVKSILSPDIFDFKSYYPEDDSCFLFLIQVIVGIKGKEGGDTFSVEVCTPKWLSENYSTGSIILGRGKLVVLEYNIDKVLKRITEYCESCTGDSWQEIVNKISRLGLWEFEDYRINA